jgi:tetratricopeptide (TPR) repeat protein
LADAHSAWKQALDILTELAGRYSDNPDLQRCWCDCANDMAWFLLKHPDLDSRGFAHALTLAMEVVDKCPDGDAYWNTLGVAYLRNGEPGAAVAALDRALANNNNPFNHVFMAMAYARLGDREQARYWLTQAILIKERDYHNHHELTCLCDEARAVVGADPETAPATV